MNVSDTLNRAADLIEEHGWRQFGGWPGVSTDAELCLEGGLIAAMGLGEYDEFTDQALIEFETCPAYSAVQDYLEYNFPLYVWNDVTATSAEEVVEVLRAAALVAAARETDVAVVSA